MTLTELQKQYSYNMESDCRETQEFREFFEELKKSLKNACKYHGVKLLRLEKSHFGAFGFFKNQNDRIVYFSIGDTRGFCDIWWKRVLYRTAKDINDYTGDYNQFCELKDLVKSVKTIKQKTV